MLLPIGFRVAPISISPFRAPGLHRPRASTGTCDRAANDLPERAVAFDGFDSNGVVKLKDIGACETINCGRGPRFLAAEPPRVQDVPPRGKRLNIEAIGEIFNLFNAINPANIESTISGVVQTVRLVGGAVNPTYMQPTRFAVTSSSRSSVDLGSCYSLQRFGVAAALAAAALTNSPNAHSHSTPNSRNGSWDLRMGRPEQYCLAATHNHVLLNDRLNQAAQKLARRLERQS